MEVEIVFLRLLALVKLALWKSEPDEALFADMDNEAWEDLFHFAVRQGVLCIAFDGVMSLPKNRQPALRSLKISWGMSVEQAEAHYDRIKQAAADIATIFGRESIRMLVFKGISLAANYPVPAHREFGDIDIYLFGQYDAGNRLLLQSGATLHEIQTYKHADFLYQGIMIENHDFLLEVRTSGKLRLLNQILLDILERDEQLQKSAPSQPLFPPPVFTAIFFMAHAVAHLTYNDPMTLHMLCDWAVFVRAHANEFDIDEWKSALRKAGLLEKAEVITSLADQYFGLPQEIMQSVEKHPELESRFKALLLLMPYPPCETQSPWGIMQYLWKRYIAKYNHNKQFFRTNLFAELMTSIRTQIRRPNFVLSLGWKMISFGKYKGPLK